MNTFTSEELYVLAALTRREFLIGVEGNTLEDNMADLRGLFKRNYAELEARGLVEYRMDGTLLLNREVRDSIRVLNKADSVVVVVANINGNRVKTHYLSYGNKVCRLTEDGPKYSLEIITDYDKESVLESCGIDLESSPVTELSIPLDTLNQLNESFSSFDEGEGSRILSGLTQDSRISSLMRDCMLKKNHSFVMKEYKKIGHHIVNTDNLILRFIGNNTIRFSVSDGTNVNVSIYEGGVSDHE